MGTFRIFRGSSAAFLCSPDCVAEREGFEPSVQFCRAKPRDIRKLHIANLTREFHTKTRHQELRDQSGFYSPSIRT